MLRHTHVLGASGDGDGGAAGGWNDVAGKTVAVFCTVPVCPDAPQRACCVPVRLSVLLCVTVRPYVYCVLMHPSTTTSQYVLRRPGTFWYVPVLPGASL